MKSNIYKELYWQLKSTANLIKTDLRTKIEDFGITWPQFHALYHINEQGTPIGDLAKSLMCNVSNLTGIIDRMESSGWVKREHSTFDRRVWIIKSTPSGQALKQKILPQHYQNIEDRLKILTAAELKTMLHLLTILKNNYREEQDNERN